MAKRKTLILRSPHSGHLEGRTAYIQLSRAGKSQGRSGMPTIDRAGVSIHYEVHGPDRAPPILLSHGYGATCRMWDGQVAAFADRCRLVLWDMRGHGVSGDPRDPTLY